MRTAFFGRLVAWMAALSILETAMGSPASGDGRTLLVNADLSELRGKGPRDWEVDGDFHYDVTAKLAVVTFSTRGSLYQKVQLPSGHYLLRALVRTNSIEAVLSAESLDYDLADSYYASLDYGGFRTPVGVAREFKLAELPFFVENDGKGPRTVTVGFRQHFGVRHQIKLEIKKMELVRLGDTVLPRRWAQNWQVDPHHGLKTLQEAANAERPGKVIYRDTGTGAEVWMMTQGGISRLQYVGIDLFSPDGKYLYATGPGAVLRTDGSAQYPGIARPEGGTPWVAPWMQRRLPEGHDPSDWIEVSRSGASIRLRNLRSREETSIPLPQRPGWELALLPTPGPQGVDPPSIMHETVVWLSKDKRQIAVSEFSGAEFRAFAMPGRLAPNNPDHVVKPFWAKGRGGTWYVGLTADSSKTWLLPTAPHDHRGLLRVVDGDQYYGMCVKEYLLEDGALAQPCFTTHRAMDCELRTRMRGQGDNTLAMESIDTGEVIHIGSYPYLERIDWSRSPDWAATESVLDPCPIFFIDVTRRAMWPVAVTNYHDFGARYKVRKGNSKFFYISPNASPDGTKIVYASTMLSAGKGPIGDIYVAVARYPQPPVHLRCEGNRLLWDRPRDAKEIRGFNLYRAERSGIGYRRINQQPIGQPTYALPADAVHGYYAATSVEHSGLESRMFSNEVAVGAKGPIRHTYEAEIAELTRPMTPIFDPQDAGNAYAVAVTDPDLLYRKQLSQGLQATGNLPICVPAPGAYKIACRVKRLKAGQPGQFALSVNGIAAGNVRVEKDTWDWVDLKGGPVRLGGGNSQLQFATSSPDIALDQILITDDLDFTPTGKGNAPALAPSQPGRPHVEKFSVAGKPTNGSHLRLAWSPSSAPQGVRYYDIHSSVTPGFAANQATLLGSSHEPVFVDCRSTAQRLRYRVVAVDSWGNGSQPSAELTVEPSDFFASRIDTNGHSRRSLTENSVTLSASGYLPSTP